MHRYGCIKIIPKHFVPKKREKKAEKTESVSIPPKEKKKVSVLSIVFLALIPLTVLFGNLFLTDRKLFTILSLVIFDLSRIYFFMSVSKIKRLQ